MWQDILGVEEYLGEKLQPVTVDEKEHEQLVSEIVKQMEQGDIEPALLNRGALLRKSMG